LRGPGGEAIRLRPKSFDMLQLFVTNSGRVLSKQDLIEAIWPNIHICGDGLYQCIRDIRTALGDDRHQLIKLVSGRGYLFDADVSARPGGLSARPGAGAETPVAQKNYELLLASIDQLYAAALDPNRWQDFLTSMAAQFEAQNAFVCEVEYRERSLAYVGLPQPGRAQVPVQRYETLIDEDPRSYAFRSSGVRPVHCRMATTTERLHRSRVYREYLRPLGIEYTMVVVLPMREGVTRDLGLTRNAEGRPFDENDRALMNRLIPHVERAFTIGGALAAKLATAPI
jgi:DNA-binding winged helix-turn-helix (wHTH) protein